MNVKGKTQLPQELPLDPLPEPLPEVVGEDVDDPVDPVDPGGEQVFAPVNWASIQLLKWLTSA